MRLRKDTTSEIVAMITHKNDAQVLSSQFFITFPFPPLWGFLFAKLATYAELNTTCNYIHRSFATALFVRLFDFMS